jgi:hypothetical protein
MKKIIYSLAAVALFVTLGAGIGCKKDNPISCTEKLAKLQAAATAYGTSSNTENCQAYKSAIQDYVSSCATGMTADQKAEYEAMIADMTCP